MRIAVVVCGLGAVLGLVAFPASAQDGRSYRVAEVDVAAELRTDGTLTVVEDRTFAYSGTYFGAFYSLPLERGQEVRGLSLVDGSGRPYQPGRCSADGRREPGAYELTSSGDEWQVTWCYPMPVTDRLERTRLTYEVTGAGTRHADASQLHWQWIGTGWEVPTDRVQATVRIPTQGAAGEDVLIWAHGPLTGEIDQPEPGVVRTVVEGVPAHTFVEVRVLMDAEVLADASSDGRAVREEILAEEGCLATAANAERARARGEEPAEDCDPQAWLAWIGNPLLLLGLVAGGGGWWAIFRRHGKEHPLPAELADYERDLPSTHPPALVGWLLEWGSVQDSALVATIMDLAQRGHISITREHRVVPRKLRRDKPEEVTVLRQLSLPEAGWERKVHKLLFAKAGDGQEVADFELKQWVEEHRDDAYAWWQSWQKAVDQAARGERWIEPKVWVAASIAIGVLLLAAAVGAAVALRGNLVLAIVVGVIGVWALGASPLMRRRTQTGRVLHHRWTRFGAFLRDFSLINEKTPDHLALWGRFIVYAVPLGVADRVMRNLDASLSAAEMETVAGGWYPIGGHSGQPSFASSLSSLTAGIPSGTIASSPSSSSGGGGGGFSGGGGGGGGGSGGGSF